MIGEVLRLINAADVHLRAMIFLGLNCGFGNTDVANPPQSAVDLETGRIDFPRPKTEIPRRIPLWPETVANGRHDAQADQQHGGELREHCRGNFITALCPTKFEPNATSYHFDRFLESIFDGNQELIDFVRRWHGCCLTGDVREQLLPVFYGDGSNGKSTLLNAIIDTIGGDYAMQADPHLLMAGRDKANQHTTYLASLFGKRFVSTVGGNGFFRRRSTA